VSERIREVLGEVDRPCRDCGSGSLIAVETRRSAPRWWDRFRTDPDRRVTRYETCLACHVIVPISTVNPRRTSGGDTLGPGYVAL
jgi:hypothetical protein